MSDDGWTNWIWHDGGKCPLSPGTYAQVETQTKGKEPVLEEGVLTSLHCGAYNWTVDMEHPMFAAVIRYRTKKDKSERVLDSATKGMEND